MNEKVFLITTEGCDYQKKGEVVTEDDLKIPVIIKWLRLVPNNHNNTLKT
jgi:hypothetical protein